LLSSEEDLLGRWRVYFEDLLNSVTSSGKQEGQLWEENSITASEVLPVVKTLKTAGCDKIRPEMLKALNRE